VILLVTNVAQDYSLYTMLTQADPVVKAVMLGLAIASVGCWAIIFEKLVRLSWLKRQIRRLEAVAKDGPNGNESGLVGTLLTAAQQEAEDGASRGEDRSAVRARLERAMRGSLKSELQRQESGLPFLATIGSSAPFIGLFGTVWGIMHAFQAIAIEKNTNLSVVAPAIAQALFATAIGLAAAIPAYIAYNKFSADAGKFSVRLESFADDLVTAIQRRLAERSA
jgi:TolQ protein